MLCAVSAEGSTDHGVPLTLRVSQESAAGEPVTVTVALEATGDSGVWIPGVLSVGGTVHLVVEGPSGSRRTYFGPKIKLAPFERDDFLYLRPGYSLGKSIKLTDYFDFATPGRYRIEVRFTSRDDGSRVGIESWTGKLVSNQLVVNVS